MSKSPENRGESLIPSPSARPGRLNIFGNRTINAIIYAIGLALIAASGCQIGEKNQYPNRTKIERCFDPNYREQFPFYEQMEIAIAVHFILDDQGNGTMNLDAVREDIDELRRVYGSFVQDFYVTQVGYYQDSTLLPDYSPQTETESEYKDKLRDYVATYGVDGAVDVLYIPSQINTGESGTGGFHTYSGNEDLVVVFTDSEGKSYAKKTIAHEMGHYFELLHPFEGDGLDSTVNYYDACSTPNVQTYIQNNTCYVACVDGSNATPANVMDYFTCAPSDDLEPLQTLTIEQLQFANCVSITVKPQNVNQDLTRMSGF